MRMVTTCSGLKPRSMAIRRLKLLIVRPAPTSSTIASATSATTSAERVRRPPDPMVARAESFNDVSRSTDDARMAGARPKAIPVRIDTTLVNARMRRSTAIRSMRGTLTGCDATNALTPNAASSAPSAPPAAAIRRLSTISCWKMRRRSAPSAARIATSRWRPSALASIRFARFAQPMSNTNATAAISVRSAGRMLRTICS